MDIPKVILGLEGRHRQQVAADLWVAWRKEGRGAAILTGISGVGKTDLIVRPLAARAREEGRPAVHINIPLHPMDLDQELLGLLIEELLVLDASLAETIQNQPDFSAALAIVLRSGTLVVLDEFQRVLESTTGLPLEPLGRKLHKLAERLSDGGCLWLVSNRLVDPGWTEPFYTAELPPPDQIADIENIVLKTINAPNAEERFPIERRIEIAQRLGANPRLLRLLGLLLRHYSLEELIGPPDDVPQLPLDPRLTEGIEQTLLKKAKEGLSDSANALLRDLTVLQDMASWELVNAMGSHLGDVRALTRELRERYLLEIKANQYQVHPVVREVEVPRLRQDGNLWRAAHLRAGTWYVKPLHAGDASNISDATIALRLAGVRYHLTEAQAFDVLREAVHSVKVYVVRKYYWSTPRPASDSERDARIALLDIYLNDGSGPPGTEYQLAKLLSARAAPGDLEKALQHARRAAKGQALADPWVLCVKLARHVEGLQAGVAVASEAIKHVTPDSSLYVFYQLLGAYLNQLEQTDKAIAVSLKAAKRFKRSESIRFIEAATFFALTESSAEALQRVREYALEEKDGPGVALCDVLLLERDGRWREAAEIAQAARKANRNNSTYLHLALHEALCWLGAAEPSRARSALNDYPREWREEPRESNNWIAALVALEEGDVPRASGFLSIYLNTTAPKTAEGIRAALLREWDHRVATLGEANPALNFPILPPAVTGYSMNVVRPQYGLPVLPQHQPRSPQPHAGDAATLRILAVATEWQSGHGGLSTFNRQLCCALAAAGARVSCIVLKASPQERQEVKEHHGVTLIEAARTPGLSEEIALTRKPAITDGTAPDFIIGHGRVTGPAALILEKDHFPSATRLHFVHMAPDEIEWHKLDRNDDAGERAQERTDIELELGREAGRVVAVGPRLYNRYLNYLHPSACPPPIRFDPGFDAENFTSRRPPPGQPLKVLVLGRLEDSPLKGLDLAAKAVGLAASNRSVGTAPLELVVRGAPPGAAAELQKMLRERSENHSLSIVVRPYTMDTERLDADLRMASLVLMPSRSEGFGLVGLEAIVAGTPVLVSSESGLGELLREVLEPEQATQFVVPVTGNDFDDGDRWARDVGAVLRDREASFHQVAELRTLLSQQRTWAASISGLLAELNRVPRNS